MHSWVLGFAAVVVFSSSAIAGEETLANSVPATDISDPVPSSSVAPENPLPVAAEGSLPFPDRGVSRDPYHNVEGYSTGVLENFRRLYIDPAWAISNLQPKMASEKPLADLVIQNTTSAWALVTVSGLKIGQIGPLRTAIVHGVPSGTYDVSFELPNQRKFTETVATR